MSRTTPRMLTAAATSLVLMAALASCGGRGDNANGGAANPAGTPAALAEEPIPQFTYKIDNAATGPASATPDAKPGGTVRVYNLADLQHLDPARIYATDESTVSLLMTRSLTGYREKGTDVTLVGDLATDTGRTTDGGKTWTYTLRDGITWEDGTAIKAAEVKYGIERTFEKDYAEGPTYVQAWLAGKRDFHSVYEGPYEGKSMDKISTPDDKTVVFSFSEPRPDLPFALAFPASSPVRKDKDTKDQYDQRPFSSGPYKIESRQVDKSMKLVRNTAWKPESDPIRTAYPDVFEFTFGEQPLQTNQRLIAAQGDDAAAMTSTNAVSPEVLQQVLGTPELKARTITGITPAVSYISINTRRITDLRVRKALMYAYPRNDLRQYLGGPDNGAFASTLLSPTLIGYEKYDLYSVPPNGDVDKAKALLAEAGKPDQTIVYAYPNTVRTQTTSVIVAQGLERAGFKVVKKPIDQKTYSDLISKPDNQFDIYGGAWLSDWPSAYTVLPPLFDGREIRTGGYNASLFDDKAISAEMDEIERILDPIEAGRRWSALDRKIMEQVPVIPNLYSKNRQLYGSRIGGVNQSVIYAGISLLGIYVKP